MKTSESANVQSVERALDILRCFTIQEQELSVAEIASKLNLPKSTVVRLLTTLKNKDFIEQDKSTQRYRLGFRLYELGNIYAADMDLRKIAYPVMVELNALTSETVNLNIINNGERVCIEKIETTYGIRNFVNIGERNSLCYGASGKVLLAFLPDHETERVMDREKLKPEQRDSLIAELQMIRKEGFALTIGNRVEGSIGLSAPIFDAKGKLIAGLTISGPVERLKPKVEELKKELLRAAHLLSAKMGYTPHAGQEG